MTGSGRVGTLASQARNRVALAGIVIAAFLIHPATGAADNAAAERIEQDLWVPSSVDSDGDGEPDMLHISVSRPAASADVPVSVVLTVAGSVAEPGAEQLLIAKTDSRRIDRLVADGFAVVQLENPGIGASQGCTDAGGPIDLAAGTAVVGFLAGRVSGFGDAAQTKPAAADWSNGRIAALGGAETGAHPLALAASGVKGLAAVVSIDDVADEYAQYRSGGSVSTPGIKAPIAGKLFVAVDAPNACAASSKDLREQADAVSGDRNTFWDNRSYLPKKNDLSASVLVLQSTAVRSAPAAQALAVDRAAAAAQAPHQLKFVLDAAAASNDGLISDWLGSVLGDASAVDDSDDSFLAEGSVTVERTAEPPKSDSYTTWPDAAAADIRLSGSASGDLLRLTAPAESGDDPELSAASNKAFSDVSADGDYVLKSAPLATDLRLSGHASVGLTVTTVVESAQNPVTAVLLCISPDGKTTVLAAGGTDLANQAAEDKSTPVAAAAKLTAEFDLDPADVVVREGDQLGLALLGAGSTAGSAAGSVADDGTVAPAAPPIPYFFDPASVRIDLPIVGGAKAADQAIAVSEPQTPGGGTGPSVGETSTTETTAPAATDPAATDPAATEPATSAPETSAPDTTEVQTTEVQTTEPTTAAPESSEPEETGSGETGSGETGSGESSTSETSGTELETALPETTLPETAVPETGLPETALPETTLPDPEGSGIPGENPTNGENPTPGGVSTIPKAPSWQAAVSAQRHSVIPVPGFFMTFTGTTDIDLAGTALTGKDQVISGQMAKIRINDGRDNPAVWNLTGQVSDFRSTNGVILAENLGWVPSAQALGPDSSVTVEPGPIIEPGKSNGLGTLKVLCSSDQAVGAVVDCGGTLQLGVPSAARTGEYKAILTLTLI